MTAIDDYTNRKKAAEKRLKEEREQEEYKEKKRQQGRKGLVGKAIGGVAGAYFGGPAGATAGASLGGTLMGGPDPVKPTKDGDTPKKKKKKKEKSSGGGDAIGKGIGAISKAISSDLDDGTDGGKHPAPAGYEKTKGDDLDFGAIANLIRAAYQAKS